MTIHELYEKYKDQRELLYHIFLELNNKTNEVRAQRDFVRGIVNFIDMKHQVETPSYTFGQVEKLVV